MVKIYEKQLSQIFWTKDRLDHSMVELFQEMKTYYSDIRIERFVLNSWDLTPKEIEEDRY